MNWLDILIAVVLIIRAFFGWRQGIIRGALCLVGSVIGVILAGNFYEPLSKVLDFIPIEYAAQIIAFVLILTCVEVVVTVLSRLLKFIDSVVMLGWVNHFGGVIFGFLIGAIEWGALLAIWVKFFGTGLVTESLLAGVLLAKAPLILALLPSEFNVIRDFFQ